MVTLHAEQQDAASGAELLEQEVIGALRGIHDPEIPVNIYDLGLIYRLDIDDDGNVAIRMTLTTPACPVAGSMPGQVECAVREVPGVRSVKVRLVWDPPWTRDRLDLMTRMELGLL
jgi:FeS assembly SUF system protein